MRNLPVFTLPPLAANRRQTWAERWCRRLLAQADVQLDGERPHDLQVRDPRMFRATLLGGSLGFGESYMNGWWDCQRLDALFTRLLSHGIDARAGRRPAQWLQLLRDRLINAQSRRRAFQVGRQHYDLGNLLYSRLLDPTMSYSCGYWARARDLATAQRDKLALICAKLGLQPGMRLLDIGCGWGGLAEYAAREHGVRVVGVTISQEQAALARERCAGLPVEIRLQDYRSIDERFDRVVSVGMFEHVGHRNYQRFMEIAYRCLGPGGLLLLHTIGNSYTASTVDPWIEKYIFPNGILPSVQQIARAAEKRFVIEDWHNFGADYDRTLMSWHANFEHAWPQLAPHYDERFHRMFRYYLLCCAGAFRARDTQLWQVVLARGGVRGGYRAPR